MTSKKTGKATLEESLKRLEVIVGKLEQGEVSLDDAIDLYEEGVNLSKECAEKLKAVELRIKKLSKSADGTFQLSAFDKEESDA
jgi:exodeoxyribonuclease VII small subunit